MLIRICNTNVIIADLKFAIYLIGDCKSRIGWIYFGYMNAVAMIVYSMGLLKDRDRTNWIIVFYHT